MVLAIDAFLRQLDQLHNQYLDCLLLLDEHLGAQLFIPGQDPDALENPELMLVRKLELLLPSLVHIAELVWFHRLEELQSHPIVDEERSQLLTAIKLVLGSILFDECVNESYLIGLHDGLKISGLK